MSFVPHTQQDIQAMLAEIAVDTVDDLFDSISEDLLERQPIEAVPDRLDEYSLLRHGQSIAAQNKTLACYIGAGAYEHHVPAACWDIASRGEYLTAYTPYQAEASQGSLQLIFEFQTMIARLTGMAVSNASLYDGASALAEAVLMAIRIQKKKPRRILIPTSVHPFYLETVRSIVAQQNIDIECVPVSLLAGMIDVVQIEQEADYAAFVIPYPNYMGVIENVNQLTDWVHAQGALVIAVVNPIALAVLKEPGAWGTEGADIVVGEGQPLGNYLNGGGPYFGFMATRQMYVRQLPGRIVGCSQDKLGQQSFTLTLQAREQHIRRSKATSNICTNQGLMVVAATIYMSLLGEIGLRTVATQCFAGTQYLVKGLIERVNCQLFNSQQYFHECVIRLPCDAEKFVNDMQQKGIAAGLPLMRLGLNEPAALLICVTETKLKKDLDDYINAACEVISK